MSTPKRERQRENRLRRLAADEAAAKQYASRRRVRLIGIAAVVVAAAIAVIAFLQRDDSEVVTRRIRWPRSSPPTRARPSRHPIPRPPIRFQS